MSEFKFSSLLPSLIQGGIGLLQNSRGERNQDYWNERNMQYQKEFYETQRRDALADWNRQNEYNSPANQRRLLEEAGYNPQLAAGQPVSAQSVRASDAPSGNGEAFRPDYSLVANGVDSYYSNQIKDGQANLVAEQVKTEKEKQDLINAQTLSTITGTGYVQKRTAIADLDRIFKSKAMDYDLEAKKLGNNRIKAQTDFTLSENLRRNELLAPTVALTLQKVLTEAANRATSFEQRKLLRAQAASVWSDVAIKKLDAELKSKGIQPHDSAFSRAVQEGLNKLSKGPGLPFIGDWSTFWDKLFR